MTSRQSFSTSADDKVCEECAHGCAALSAGLAWLERVQAQRALFAPAARHVKDYEINNCHYGLACAVWRLGQHLLVSDCLVLKDKKKAL